MKLSEIYKIADELAPKALSDEMCAKYGFYDNSGILVNTGEEIKGIVCSLDLSKGAVDLALERGANLIITHHPAIYGKISSIDCESGVLGEKLVRCIREGISVLSMHLNLDAAQDGIDESLMQGVALATKTKGAGMRLLATQCELSGGGYGRVYEVNGCALGELADGMKEIFQTQRVETYGDINKRVTRIASFCGAGADEGAIAFAVANGTEVMVSSDFKHHLLALATELGLSVVTLTHCASESYDFKKYYKKICQRVEVPCVYHEEKDLL